MIVEGICDELVMFTKKDGKEHDQKTKCVVFNRNTGVIAPSIPIGSWTARVFGWRVPNENVDLEGIPTKKIREKLYEEES